MYKVMMNNVVIDVLEELKYVRYLKKSKRLVVVNDPSASCIAASNNTDVYHIEGSPYPEGLQIKTVTVSSITADEYSELLSSLNKNETVVQRGLRYIKQNKLKEMSDICHTNIVRGTRVFLSDKQFHHFELTVEDQVNLLDIRYGLDAGIESFVYHETGKVCKEYSATDMRTIVDTLYKHKQKHLQYFNKLKREINDLQSIDDVINVRYELQ